MGERKKWSPQEIEQFERAWRYLKEKTPEIKAGCADFNESNGRGLITTFWAQRLQWGTLSGSKLASGEKRAQRMIYDMYGAGTGVFLAVNTLTDEEANLIGEFAARIGKDYNLRARREWERPGQDLTELRYSIKPYFEQFK